VLYHHFRSAGGPTAPPQYSNNGAGRTYVTHSRNSLVDIRHEDGIHFSRRLEEEEEDPFEDGDGEGDSNEDAPSPLAEEPCPELEISIPKWLAALYGVGTLYMILALSIVCDEFFVPALEEISSERRLNLSMDVAGATLMAAGGSAPELFTSFIGTFKQSDIAIGTVLGSQVFNVLLVIGVCSLLSKEVLTLTCWPLFRDMSYYALGLLVLSVVVGVVTKGEIYWWEALILLGMYLGYVILMYYNQALHKKLTGKALVSAGESNDDTGPEGEVDVMSAEMATNSVVARAGGGKGYTPLLWDDYSESSSSHSSSGLSPKATSPSNTPTTAPDISWPGTFHAGVIKLLVQQASQSVKEQVGGNGSIDKDDLRELFTKHGHEVSDEELGEFSRRLDFGGDGTIHGEEFLMWYLKSEDNILSKVKPIFNAFDAGKSGIIGRNELKQLLHTLDPRFTELDVDDAIKSMCKSCVTEEIMMEEFVDWYAHSIAYSAGQQTLIERQTEEDGQRACCYELLPPSGEGVYAWLNYILVLPLVAILTVTIPNARHPNCGKWCYVSFILSIVWIGLFSYFMVDWVEIVGNNIGIPPVVMGYTILAAGTSAPDLISSVIVARMGEGDMAISSSIGSNIFDILVGLPLPWLVFTLWPTTPDFVKIQAAGIWRSIYILIGTLVATVAIIHCLGWKMSRTLGGIMFLLYFVFIAQAIATEYITNACF